MLQLPLRQRVGQTLFYTVLRPYRLDGVKGHLALCFGKDIIEKAFRSLKGVTQLRPIRLWLSKRVRAHGFVGYLAYLLLSLLEYRLRQTIQVKKV